MKGRTFSTENLKGKKLPQRLEFRIVEEEQQKCGEALNFKI